jgi:hypothetical protein
MFLTEKLQSFSIEELVPRILWLKMIQVLLRRTHTQYLMITDYKVFGVFFRRSGNQYLVTGNDKVFSQEKSWQSISQGELVPKILWVKMTIFFFSGEVVPNIYDWKWRFFSEIVPNILCFSSGEDASNILWVQILQENLMRTISPGEVVPGYDFSRVRFLLGTTSPGYDFSRRH